MSEMINRYLKLQNKNTANLQELEIRLAEAREGTKYREDLLRYKEILLADGKLIEKELTRLQMEAN